MEQHHHLHYIRDDGTTGCGGDYAESKDAQTWLQQTDLPGATVAVLPYCIIEVVDGKLSRPCDQVQDED